MKGTKSTPSSSSKMGDSIKRSRSVPMSPTGSRPDPELTKLPPTSSKKRPPPTHTQHDLIPTPPLTDVLLRAIASPPFLLSLFAYVRLSWSLTDLLYSLRQALAASANTCTLTQTSLQSLQSVPAVALQSVLSTATASIHASVDSLASAAGFAIHLARGVVMQFAVSQTRLWRCLVDMVLKATQGVLVSAVADAQSAWNAGLTQLTSDVNRIIDALNSQLLRDLGNDFQRIFGGSTITSTVTIPRINDIFVGSLTIPDDVTRAFRDSIQGIPSVNSLFDELEVMISRPLEVLADQVRDKLGRVADGLVMNVPQLELDRAWLALEESEAWKMLGMCARGEWSEGAIRELEPVVRRAFAWYLNIVLIVGVGALASQVAVDIGNAAYMRWRLRPARLAKWQQTHVQLLPWVSPAAGMAWYKARPLEYRVVKSVLRMVHWTRRVRGHAENNIESDQQLARYLVRVFAFLTHRPTVMANLVTIASLLVTATQLYLLDNPSAFTTPVRRLSSQIPPLLLTAANSTLTHVDSQLNAYSRQVNTDLALASQYLSTHLAGPLIDSLAVINTTLSETTSTIQSTVGSLLSPVPILQSNVQALIQCIAGRYVELITELAALATRATTVTVTAEWKVANMVRAQAAAAARRVVMREVEAGQVGRFVDEVMDGYRERLERENRLAWVALGVTLAPVVLGVAVILLEFVVNWFVGWCGRDQGRSDGRDGGGLRTGGMGLSYLKQLKLLRAFRTVVHWYADHVRAVGDSGARVLQRLGGLLVALMAWPVASVAGIGVAVVSRL